MDEQRRTIPSLDTGTVKDQAAGVQVTRLVGEFHAISAANNSAIRGGGVSAEQQNTDTVGVGSGDLRVDEVKLAVRRRLGTDCGTGDCTPDDVDDRAIARQEITPGTDSHAAAIGDRTVVDLRVAAYQLNCIGCGGPCLDNGTVQDDLRTGSGGNVLRPGAVVQGQGC